MPEIHVSVIDPLHPSGLVGQERLEAGELLLRKPEMMGDHHVLLSLGNVKSCQTRTRNTPCIGPGPSQATTVAMLAPRFVAVEIGAVHQSHVGRAALKNNLDNAATDNMTKIVMGKLHNSSIDRFRPSQNFDLAHLHACDRMMVDPSIHEDFSDICDLIVQCAQIMSRKFCGGIRQLAGDP